MRLFVTLLQIDWKEAALLPIGELVASIKATPRDQSVAPPQEHTIFNTALVLQAGLRVLALTAEERKKVAFPPKSFPNDPEELKIAQKNWAEVLESGKEQASHHQQLAAMESVSLAITQISQQGYLDYAEGVLMSWTGWTDKRESCRVEKTSPALPLDTAQPK
jgi:hypothetical protein